MANVRSSHALSHALSNPASQTPSQFWPALRSYFVLTILLGLLYPLIVMAVGQMLFPHQARGSFIEKNGVVIGSQLIGQKFESPRYFWPRPSAVEYNPLATGGSNLGPTSQALKELVDGRIAKLGPQAPQGLLFASGSGIDPEIDLETAAFQIDRIAQTRGVPSEGIRRIVESQLKKRDLGFLGEERINVLRLNLALDVAFESKNP